MQFEAREDHCLHIMWLFQICPIHRCREWWALLVPWWPPTDPCIYPSIHLSIHVCKPQWPTRYIAVRSPCSDCAYKIMHRLLHVWFRFCPHTSYSNEAPYVRELDMIRMCFLSVHSYLTQIQARNCSKRSVTGWYCVWWIQNEPKKKKKTYTIDSTM